MGLLILALLASAPPQSAPATPAPSTPAAPAKAGGKKAGLICEDQAVIGSRLGGRRVCRTAAEWANDRREVRDDTERAQRLNKLPGQ